MKVSRFAVVVIISIILAVSLLSCQKSAPPDPTAELREVPPGETVIAKVGGTVLVSSQIDEKQKMFRYGDHKKNQVLEDLITNRLLYLGALTEGIDKDPSVRMRIREHIERTVGQVYLNEKVANMGINESDIKKYYDEHRDEFRIPDQAVVSQILLPTAERAEEVKQEVINKVKLFSEAAGEYSQDAQSASQGGRLGTVTKGGYIPLIGISPEINEAIFAASAGTILGPFQSARGFHLFSIDSLESGRFEELEKVKRQILERMIVTDTEINEYYERNKEERFKRKSFIRIKHIQAASQADAEKIQARLAKGESFDTLVTDLVNTDAASRQSPDPFILYHDGYLPRVGLERDQVDMLFQLEPEQTSPILQSKTGWHIFKLYEKSPDRYHEIEAVRSGIVSTLANQKRSEAKNKLMQDLERQFAIERLLPSTDTPPASPSSSREAAGPAPEATR